MKNATTPTAAPRTLLWTLRLTVAVQCLGLAWQYAGSDSPIFDVLCFDWGYSETTAETVDAIGWWLLALSSLLIFIPFVPVPLALAVWQVLLALASWRHDEGFMPALAPLEQAVRYAAPLALALLAPWPKPRLPRWWSTSAEWLLRLAAAATFIAHGLEASYHNPRFVDLIVSAGDRFGLPIDESTAQSILSAIGPFDIALAVAIVAVRSRLVAGYMTFWGLLTASSRTLEAGLDWLPLALARITNGGVPLALCLYWWRDQGIGNRE